MQQASLGEERISVFFSEHDESSIFEFRRGGKQHGCVSEEYCLVMTCGINHSDGLCWRKRFINPSSYGTIIKRLRTYLRDSGSVLESWTTQRNCGHDWLIAGYKETKDYSEMFMFSIVR